MINAKFMIKKLLENEHVKKGVYVLTWGVVAFVSSFMDVLHGDFSFIKVDDVSRTIFAPVLIWSIAFLVDYIYEIDKMVEGKHRLSKTWTKISYFMIAIILLSLLINVFSASLAWRIVGLVLVFLSMLTLKVSSLYVLCPEKKVRRLG